MAGNPPPVSDPTALLIGAIERATGLAARRAGREFVVRCPVHRPDRNPSGNIRQGDGGYPIWVCRSQGCTMEQVLREVGLHWSDIFGNDDDRWTPNGPYQHVYDYVDENGELLYQVCRTADKKFSQRRPSSEKKSGWDWSLNGTRRVPFRLPKVIQAAKVGETVYVVEGEKDVLTLERRGLVATCNSGGAGKWEVAFGQFLAGANVVVVADKDEPGRKHALAVWASAKPHARSVQLRWPKVGKDVSDHLDAGLGLDALVLLDTAEAEQEISALSETHEPAEEDDAGAPPPLVFLPGKKFIAQPLSDIQPLVGTLDDALVMPKSLTMVAGIGGSGKTTLVLHAMAHWAAGLPWFGIETARPLRFLVIENEGPHDPFIRKVGEFTRRFVGCPCGEESHGDGSEDWLDNCLFLDAPWGKFTFDDAGFADQLLNAALEFKADIVVANPLGRLGMRGAGAPEETRAFVSLLTNCGLGDAFGALLIHHMAKANPTLPLIQQISGDWGPHADSILVMEPAGERRSKLSFGKVRWGDQGRAPLVLDWLTDPEGPVGYKVQGQLELSEEDRMSLQQRIDAYLRSQAEPVSMTNIKTAVKGKAQMIVNAIQQGIESGRYQTSGGTRARYWLTAQSGIAFTQEPELE